MTSSLPPGSSEAVTIAVDGTSYSIVLPDRATDYIQGRIADQGQPYEHAMLTDMASRLVADEVVVDAGANIGNHTLYLAAVVGCQVEAFEPDAALTTALTRSVTLNALTEVVTVHAVALGALAGSGTLITPDRANIGGQHIEMGSDGDIAVVSLDSVAVRRPVRALKVDVEGMELDVLRGAARIIEEDRPLLYVECGTEASFGALATWLDERGFAYWETFNATPTHLFVPAEGLAPEQLSRRLLLKTVREAFRSAETVAGIRSRLDQANGKYRSATRSLDLAKHERAAATANATALQGMLDDARTTLADVQQVAEAQRAAHLAAESAAAAELAAAHAEGSNSQRELHALKLRGTADAQQAKQARHKASALRAELKDAKGELRVRTERLQEAERRLEETLLRIRASEREREEAQAQAAELARVGAELVGELRDVRDEAEHRIAELVRRFEASERELDETRARATRSDTVGAERAGEVKALREEVSRLGPQLIDAASQLVLERSRTADLTASVGAAWTEAGKLAAVVEREQAAAADLAAELRSVRAERDQTLALGKAAVIREKQALAREVTTRTVLRDLRTSATFRTGKEVKRASTSLAAALTLPARLWAIAREMRPTGTVIEGQAYVVPAPMTALPAADNPATSADDAGTEVTGEFQLHAVEPVARQERSTARLRVAAIVDEFTGLSLEPECELHHLTPENWRAELETARPQLLFVESAWRGKNGRWHNTVGQLPVALREIMAWCSARGVPTAFWNKEDPVHFSTFLTTARAFDLVFTTDLDCIGRYKAALGHERVWLLPFACQPRLHHPLEDSARKDAFSFAGSYYRRYPERTRDLDSFLAHLPAFRPVEIFDRNFGSDDENYSFPADYQGYVVGTLPPERVSEAYKGYRFGINLNSVKQSQTMFARRIFELLGSNTVTVSNFSRGVRLMFGDLVVTTDSGQEAVRQLEQFYQDDDHLDRLRLAALRSVMSQHTYEDRLAYVVSKVTGTAVPEPLPVVALVGRARTDREADQLLAQMRRQQGVRWQGVLLVDSGVDQTYQSGVTVLRTEVVRDQTVGDTVKEAGLVAVLHAEDYYGPHYALDLALATRYCDADVIGKRTRFRVDGDSITLMDVGAEYRRAGRLPVRASLVRTALVRHMALSSLVEAVDGGVHEGGDQVAVDRFGYCESGATSGERVARRVDDIELWPGIPVVELQRSAEGIEPAPGPGDDLPSVPADRLSDWFAGRSVPEISHEMAHDGWRLTSTLDDGVHDYLYASELIPVGELWPGGTAEAYVDTAPGLRLQFVFVFQDEVGRRLGGAFFALAQQNASMDIPDGCATVKVGVRALGPGMAPVRRVVLGQVETEPGRVVSTSRHLVLTNHYPSYDDLYRNAFVHSRVRAYREHGVRAEVFRLRPRQVLQFDEFEGMDVLTGDVSALTNLLGGATPRSLLVHFLDRAMWSVLAALDHSVRIIVWLHGAEVQAWWRRSFNHTTEAELEQAKEISEERLLFWREVFSDAPTNMRFVFVSQYLADTAMEDLGVHLDPSRYSIIHNPIDVDLFDYAPKDAEQRLKVLSIRPFVSATYANDLTVAAIVQLRQEVWFDELQFRIVGDGPLFDKTVAPVRGLPNVRIQQGFVTHREISALHKEYGVFLVPTRMDTQGVSRDEAMASGLVPVSNAVAAVPEFVDADSGILVAGEDPKALAQAITRLREEPAVFQKLSQGAAARVRHQSGAPVILERELSLIVVSPEEGPR